MKLNADKVKIGDCLSVGEFVKLVRDRTQNPTVSTTAIHYHLKDDSETLDFVEWCGMKMIVQNEKAANFKIGAHYGKIHTANRMQL